MTVLRRSQRGAALQAARTATFSYLGTPAMLIQRDSHMRRSSDGAKTCSGDVEVTGGFIGWLKSRIAKARLAAALMLAGWALAASCGGAGNPTTLNSTPAPARADATSTLDPSPTPLAATQTSAARVERIAYIGVDGNVWSMDPAGNEKTQLTSDGGNSSPRLSPDGARV